MNPKHPAWWLLPIVGMISGWFFRPSEDAHLPVPTPSAADVRTLNLPNGEALRFRKGPGMTTWISETEVPGRWLSDLGKDEPTLKEAREVCRTLSQITGHPLRLPTLQEWREAARAGIQNLPFPWGYEKTPPSSLHFGLNTPPTKPGPAFGWGFKDLAGGRWEWTQEGELIGSAWSETDPTTLQISHAWTPPQGYGDQDTGMRLAWGSSAVPAVKPLSRRSPP